MIPDTELFLDAYLRVYETCRRRTSDDPTVETVTERQGAILQHLDRFDPVMVGELAEHLGVTASTMSLNLGRLVRAGLVVRERDPDDRRVMNVLLTAEGERTRDAHAGLSAERVDRLLQSLGPVERRQAMAGLALLARAAETFGRQVGEHLEALTAPRADEAGGEG